MVARTASREIHNAYFREYYAKMNPERRAKNRLLAKVRSHGITIEQLKALELKQNGLCACCSRELKPDMMGGQCIDHDHITNEIRGLLCHYCNSGIGMLGDTYEDVEKALIYLAPINIIQLATGNGS